jgi:NAD(P)-dependent dehydrogenase (short-subunit alcohol dehydrogenase family)
VGYVALLTAAAHRRGKGLVAALVEARGRRGPALRFNANDPASVALALTETLAKLGAVDLLVHVAPHELVGPPARFDACTAAALPDLRTRRGAVIYLLDPGDAFPSEPAAAERVHGVLVVGLQCQEGARPGRAGRPSARGLRELLLLGDDERAL